MAVIGVVCEYNPFHKGHAYHLQESRRLLGEESTVVCVMSGDFVQRGEAALYSKFARAEAACRCGADLVVELPLPWALSSAERFAAGAVHLLGALVAEALSFGSECGDAASLARLAESLRDPELYREIKQLLSEEAAASFAAARQRVLADRLGEEAALLGQPNNILGVSYLKAIADQRLRMKPVTIARRGSGHDEPGEVLAFSSASRIRRLILEGEDTDETMPEAAAQVFTRQRELGRQLNPAAMELAVLSRLRMFDMPYFEALPDASDGLGKRLYSAVQTENSLKSVQAAAKTKRYAMARIRRICMCACLGITAGMNEGLPPYARILAANGRGQKHLAALRAKTELPILIKHAAVHKLPSASRGLFEQGAKAHDF